MNIRTTVSCLSMFVCSSLLIKSLYIKDWKLCTVAVFSLILSVYFFILNKRYLKEIKSDTSLIDEYNVRYQIKEQDDYFVKRQFEDTEDEGVSRFNCVSVRYED